MRCKVLVIGLCALTLVACNRGGSSMAGRLTEVRANAPGEGSAQFSFVNFWSFEMRRDTIAPRFERTRTACLSSRTLNCKLVSSSINTATSEASYVPQASLQVLLPHNQIEAFKKAILSPVPGETTDEIVLRSNITRAENVEGQGADADRKVLRLSAYRDRLLALSKRPNLSIEDTIRLEAEIVKVQGDLDDAIKDKSDADRRIARETVDISFEIAPKGAIAAVFSRAANTFVESVANALEFLIGVIPWLPIVAAAIALITWLVRFLWRRKRRDEG